MTNAPQDIVIIAELHRRRLQTVTNDLHGCAAAIARLRPGRMRALIIGDGCDDAAGELSRRAGLDVDYVRVPGLKGYNGETFRDVLAQLLHGRPPAYICVAHSAQGRDLAPALAIRLKAACISAVYAVADVEGRLCFGRSIGHGKFTAYVASACATTVVTITPGSFPPPAARAHCAGTLTRLEAHHRPRSIGEATPCPHTPAPSPLADAKVIVAAGNGVGSRNNLDLIRQMAQCFRDSAVAGSRAICDRGWMTHARQVGETGATVAPALYLACGISGAPQHLAGMRGSGFIVAINRDPRAPIMNAADVCIAEDLSRFIPAFIKVHRQKTRHPDTGGCKA